jgi:hypothetical protein
MGRGLIFIYDPNCPGEDIPIPVDFSQIGLGFRYGEYTNFYTLIPHETLIGSWLGMADMIEKKLKEICGIT